jgi:putative tricarboxylic transport membrane protein
MRIDDRLLGLILAAFGVAIWLVASTFPVIGGMDYGPGFFPTIAAIGLLVCGIVIAVTGAVKARAAPATGAQSLPPQPPRASTGGLLRPVLICLIVLGFGLALQPLGFHISAAVAVTAAAFVFGAGPFLGITLGIAAAFGAHYVFYSLLRVPLPWGVLTPVAW